MSAELSKELVLLVLQFLDEEKYKQTVHRLESESGVFCNFGYIEELITKGDWDELEKYLDGFINIQDNRYSVKILFEVRKQKYLEAVDRKDHAKAVEILNKDLKIFKTFNEEVFKQLTFLLTVKDIRENEQLAQYADTKTTRSALLAELKKLIGMNPQMRDKCQFPSLKHSRLRLLVNQSLNWQHQLCVNPKPNPDIKTILVDHTCGPSKPAHGQAPVTSQYVGPIIKAGAFQPTFQSSESAQAFYATSLTHRSVNPSSFTVYPTSGGSSLVNAVHNTSDSGLLVRRSRSFGMLDEIGNLPTSSVALARGSQSNFYSFLPPDNLPKNVILSLNQGSDVRTMDFHPEHQTLLLVGTNTGDIAIWEVGSRLRVAHRGFSLWNIRTRSMAFQASLSNEYPVLVNRVMWSPDGLLLGAAYSKNIVHIFSYRGSHELRDHLEIDAHVGNVNDLAFVVKDRKFALITCGEDKTIKVWDAITGANHLTFEGHDAPVYSVCPHQKANIQARDIFFFSTSIDGKIKAWQYDKPGPVLQIDSPGYACTRMKYSADGLRIFSCGSNKNWESFILEWNDDDGIVKQKYNGLANQYAGVVQFDTTKRFLAAGDEFSIKFWDMDNDQLLFSTNADGGLPALPCVQFNKSGTLLAVSTSDNGFKILGNAEGLRLVKSIENQTDAHIVASATVSKASAITTCAASSSAAGASNGLPDRKIPLPVMAALNQDSQNSSNVMLRDTSELEFSIIWRPKEVTEPSQLRCTRLPDTLLPVRITRLMYAVSGSAVLALGYNAVHKLWKWEKTEQNTTGNATADVAPQLWQPSSGILMTNDIADVNVENTIPCLAISKNSSYVMSASGGKVSLFNLVTFKTLTTFMDPPPAATCLIFHPQDNNIVAVGMSDASINIYNVRTDQVMNKLTGHNKSVTGLAFSADNKILISAGADAQLCLWNTESWERLGNKFLKLPFRRANNPLAETRVQFSMDQSRFLVVHESQVAIYNLVKLDCLLQWVPRTSNGSITDAVYSCDGKSIFVSIEDGNVNILTANQLRLKCRINCAAFMPSPSNSSATRVYPCTIAAHPSEPNQFALGLSDGGVYVLEPLESDREWGSDPYLEQNAGPSTSTIAAAGAPGSDQA